jgi:hypothetical protein
VVHAQVEPHDDVLVVDALAAKELAKVVLRLGSEVDVLPAVGVRLLVVVLCDGQVRLGELGLALAEVLVEYRGGGCWISRGRSGTRA